MSSRASSAPLTTLGSLWLLGALALVMAPHLLRFPPWLSLICVLAVSWRIARDLRGWALPGTGVRVALTIGGIGAVFAAFGTIIGQEAGVALLAVMLGLKLVEMAVLRDATVVILLAYFLVATGFLFDDSLLAGAYLFGTVVVLTAALVVINHPGARPELARDYLRRSALLLLQSVPLMAVLFVLFPRVQAMGWGLTTAPVARTGLSDSMTIGDVSQLALSPEVAFRVEFQGAPPLPGNRFWRGPVLWHTDGRKWTTLTPAEMQAAGPPHPFTALGPPVDYTLSLPDSTSQWLPALDLPRLVPERVVATTDLQMFRVARLKKGGGALRYQMRSYPQFQWMGITPRLRADALALPPGKNPRTTALGGEWRARFSAPRQRVQEALRYFREEPLRYTLHPPPLGEEPIDQFLFLNRSGFCEHYSAAFVVLMRAAGVPARVVTGYEGGELNPLGNYWTIRQSDAHAWAEVYLEDEGWVRVDPTAVIPPARIDVGTRAAGAGAREGAEEKPWTTIAWQVAGQSWDAVNFHWNRWIAGYSAERQKELLSRIGVLAWGRLGLLALLVLAAGAVLTAAIWFSARTPRDADPAVRLYRRFCHKLARVGVAREQNEGERAYALRVSLHRPELAEQVSFITDLYQQTRYGRPAQQQLSRLKTAVAAFRPRSLADAKR